MIKGEEVFAVNIKSEVTNKNETNPGRTFPITDIPPGKRHADSITYTIDSDDQRRRPINLKICSALLYLECNSRSVTA